MSEHFDTSDFNLFLGRAISYLLILTVLKYDSEHSGYSLIKRLEDLSEGKLRFRAGTVYPQIEKLKEDGLIKRHIQDAPSRSEDFIRKKAVYTLTSKGLMVLNQVQMNWNSFQHLIQKFVSGQYRD